MKLAMPILLLTTFSCCISAQPLERDAFVKVFKDIECSVVTIGIKETRVVDGEIQTLEGHGSGVVLDTDGLIVTNKHVVSGGTREVDVFTCNNEVKIPAKFVAQAPDTDVSFIKMTNVPAGVKPIAFGDSDAVREGQWVLVVGSPFGLGGTLTVGIVSARQRPVPIPSQSGTSQPHSLIQTDASINPGNSGGAMVDLNGKLIGIPTLILSQTGTSTGVGFAIPSNVVKKLLEDATNKREAVGSLGVLVQSLSELSGTIRKQLGVTAVSGVLITGFEFQGAAQKAGLKLYDIIVEVDDKAVKDENNFRWLERNLDPGAAIKIKIVRAGKEETIKLVVGKPIQQKTG